jgi:glycosyltransferase involved in cell wall biosynthesis
LGSVGIATYTRDLIIGLDRSKVRDRVTILCPPWLTDHPAVLSCGLDVKVIGRSLPQAKGVRSLFWSELVGKMLAGNSGAVFHSPGLHASFALPARTYITCHDLIPLRYPVYFGRNFFRKWNFRRNLNALKCCQGVFTDSQASRQDLIQLAGISSAKIHLLPCWIASEFNPTVASKLKNEIKERYLLPDRYWLYVGGFDIRKNIPFLLKAYATALARGVDCPPLVLAGRIPQRKIPSLCDVESALEKMGSHRQRVVFPGFIAQNDLPGLYGGAELFIYPSLFEGFGLPPLEAMGCGCPAVVADNSSLPEVVRDSAYRFSTESPDTLVELMKRAASMKLPLNPNFDRDTFSLEASMRRYLAAIDLEASPSLT